MPAPPYYAQLPLDGNSRRYVDQSAWDSVIGAFYAWPDHVNANQKNLSNLGVLSFAAGGYIAGGSAVGAFAVAANNALLVRSAANYDSALSLFEASSGYGFTLKNIHNDGLHIIRHHGDPTGAVALYISRAAGNVGIGTASPTFRLEVAASIASYAAHIANSASGGSGLWISAPALTVDSIPLAITGVGDAPVLTVKGSNVGIGMVPTHALDVAGSIWSYGSSGALGVQPRNGSGATFEWYNEYGTNLRLFGNGVNLLHIDTSGRVIQKVVDASADGEFPGNGFGNIYVNDGAKTIYMKYKDAGGVFHTVVLGTWT